MILRLQHDQSVGRTERSRQTPLLVTFFRPSFNERYNFIRSGLVSLAGLEAPSSFSESGEPSRRNTLSDTPR